ncbi:MAG: SsrA-binding protein SmpB [Planctomycetota bacterium]|nr:MAG: SsrA-binding protein SmpB [Planctomycetota bacterium]
MANAASRKAHKQAAAEGIQLIVRNKRVTHDYEILDSMEAGLVLAGSEVKSLREGNVQFADAHARLDDAGECWLYNLHIGEYRQAGIFNHLTTARRKVLLQRRELKRLIGTLQTKGLSLVPLRLYFKRGWAKMELCVVRGRKHEDKRRHLQNQARDRDIQRELARRLK